MIIFILLTTIFGVPVLGVDPCKGEYVIVAKPSEETLAVPPKQVSVCGHGFKSSSGLDLSCDWEIGFGSHVAFDDKSYICSKPICKSCIKMKMDSGKVDLKMKVEYGSFEAPVGVTCKYRALNGSSTGKTEKPNEKTTVKPNVKTTVKPNDKTTVRPNDKTTVKPNDKTTVKPNEKTTVKPNDKTTAKPNDKTTAKPNGKTTVKPSEGTTAKPNATNVTEVDSPESVKKIGNAVLDDTDSIKNISEQGLKKVGAFSTSISVGSRSLQLRTPIVMSQFSFHGFREISRRYGRMYMANNGFFTSTCTIFMAGSIIANFQVGGFPGFIGFGNGGFYIQVYYYFIYRRYRFVPYCSRIGRPFRFRVDESKPFTTTVNCTGCAKPVKDAMLKSKELMTGAVNHVEKAIAPEMKAGINEHMQKAASLQNLLPSFKGLVNELISLLTSQFSADIQKAFDTVKNFAVDVGVLGIKMAEFSEGITSEMTEFTEETVGDVTSYSTKMAIKGIKGAIQVNSGIASALESFVGDVEMQVNFARKGMNLVDGSLKSALTQFPTFTCSGGLACLAVDAAFQLAKAQIIANLLALDLIVKLISDFVGIFFKWIL